MCSFNSLKEENWENQKYSNGKGNMRAYRCDCKKMEEAVLIRMMARQASFSKHDQTKYELHRKKQNKKNNKKKNNKNKNKNGWMSYMLVM